MKTLRASFLVTTAALALSGTAYAADLTLKAPVAMAPIPVGTWQGGYIGGNIGVARLNTVATGVSSPAEFGYAACGPSSGSNSNLGGASCATSDSNFTAGVQAGYDFQSRFFVYGVVADWSWTGLNHTTSFTNISSLPFVRAQVDWMATFRGRMGLAVDDTYVYLTGGLAIGHIKSGAGSAGDCPTYCYDNSPNTTKAGWVAGMGAEHKITQNMSFFTEVLYYDFGHMTATSTTQDGTYTYSTELHNEILQAKLGINYRF